MAEAGRSAGCANAGAGEPKATSVEEGLLRRERKAARLKREAAAAQRKALQKRRVADEASRKRQHERSTISSYFGSSRNADNREMPLDRSGACGGLQALDGERLAAMESLHLADLHSAAPTEGKPDVTIELSIAKVVEVTSEESEEPNPEGSDKELSGAEELLSPARGGHWEETKNREGEEGRGGRSGGCGWQEVEGQVRLDTQISNGVGR